MTQEENTPEENARDYAKFIWLGVVAMFVAMVAAMFLYSRESDSGRSTARAQHILVKFNSADPSDRQRSLELISNLRERILAGEDFARLARDYSDDSVSAARGGDLGYHPKGTFETEFEKQVWSLPTGELSDIIITRHGFHILQVRERKLSKMDQYEMEIERKADEFLQN